MSNSRASKIANCGNERRLQRRKLRKEFIAVAEKVVVEPLSGVLVFSWVLSVDKGYEAVCVVIHSQCKWLKIGRKPRLVRVRNRGTSQDGVLVSKRALA